MGPYGALVPKGRHESAIPTDGPMSQTVFYVFHMIRGAPCCWWDALDATDVSEITGSDGFRWLGGGEQPGLEFGFASIELEAPFSRESASLDLLANPLIAAVCRQSRLEAMLTRVRRGPRR
jgi:hypothetical protein